MQEKTKQGKMSETNNNSDGLFCMLSRLTSTEERASGGIIHDAAGVSYGHAIGTELLRTVVRPASELLLDGLGEEVTVDNRVGWSFACEFGVKVFDVSSIGLEGKHVSGLLNIDKKD